MASTWRCGIGLRRGRGILARQRAGALDIIQPMRLSARNRLVGVITEIKLGDIMAHVTIKVGEHLIESVITLRSADRDGFFTALKQRASSL